MGDPLEHQSRARIPRESTIERGTAPKRLHYILRTTTPLRNRTSTPPMNKGPVFLTITTTGCLIYTYGERLWMRIISKNVVTFASRIGRLETAWFDRGVAITGFTKTVSPSPFSTVVVLLVEYGLPH